MSGTLVLLVGPTASGKSSLAERLATETGGEIVSADALQVYRRLDIGTAKPPPAIRERIPHHCIDVLDPDERCTAGRYARLARAAIEDVLRRGRPCFLVGGSGFYVSATLEGLDALPRTDPAWRAALEGLHRRRGPRHLHRLLVALDPVWASRIDPADRQRLVRALEVVLRTGRPLAQQRSAPAGEIRPVVEWGLHRERAELYRRIDQRVDRMLAAGWLHEVEGLLASGVDPDTHALQAIGYRDLVRVLAGEIGFDEARGRIVRATRRYAKRQLTWFRRRATLQWIDAASVTPEGLLRALDALGSRGNAT